jgi:hypothetical protein
MTKTVLIAPSIFSEWMATAFRDAGGLVALPSDDDGRSSLSL